MRRDPRTTTVSFSLTAEQAKKLYDFCDTADISVSKFVSRLVIAKLEQIHVMGADNEED